MEKERYQVTFRLSKEAYAQLEQEAELYLLQPSQYAKACLLAHLHWFQDSIDRRRRGPPKIKGKRRR